MRLIPRPSDTSHSHRAVVNDLSWSPNGNIVATAGGDGLVRLFDIRTFKELDALKGHEKEVTAVAWHPSHTSLLTTGGMDGSLLHWGLDSATPSTPLSRVAQAHDQVVWTLDYHPLGYVLASGSKDYSTRFWARARPTGGQETDRWHVGEAESQRAGTFKQQRVEDDDMGGFASAGAEMRLRQLVTLDCCATDEDTALPGLGGSNQPASLPGLSSQGPPLPGMGPTQGLPGLAPPQAFSGPRPGPGGPTQMAGRGPLPSQEDMLNIIGVPSSRQQRGATSGGGRRSRWGG